MGFNIPTVTENNLSFGPGIVYLGAAGATPSTDVGAVEAGISINFKREMLDLEQGGPKVLVKRVCIRETAEIEFNGLEWNLQNLQRVLGGGVFTDGANDDTLEGGGDMNFDDLALKFVHQQASGGTVTVSFWKVNGSGEASIQFGDEWHKFPAKFSAQQATTDWASASLAEGKQLFKIFIEDPP